MVPTQSVQEANGTWFCSPEIHRDTGAHGPDAQTMYDQYMKVKMPNLLEECLQPHHSSSAPCPEDALWKGCIHQDHPI